MAFVAGAAGVTLARTGALRTAPALARAGRGWGGRPRARAAAQRARVFATAAPPPPQHERGAGAAAGEVRADAGADAGYAVKLLFDGECPLCVREVEFLRRRSLGHGAGAALGFVDIAGDAYCAEEHGGIDYATAMGRIHAITRDGDVLVGVPAFRRVYDEIGLGWVYAATALPVLGPLVDWVYAVWADRRLQVTGRPPLPDLLAAREKRTCR